MRQTIGNLIALSALVLSICNYCQIRHANFPNVTIDPRLSPTFWICNKSQGEWNFIALIPFRIINSGGQPASFVGLRSNPKLSPVRATYGVGDSRPIGAVLFFPKTIDQSLSDFEGLIPEDVEDQLLRERRVWVNYESVPKDAAVDFDHQNVSVGQPETLIIGLLADSVKNVSKFDINLVFDFDHRKNIPVSTQIKVDAPSGRDRCP
jgi:hypothetical protein